MKRTIIAFLTFLMTSTLLMTQTSDKEKPYYDDKADPMEQIDNAIAKAKQENKYVMCQLGGNWCKWCRWFGKFIEDDKEIAKVIDDNFVYIHVNYGNTNDERTKPLIRRTKNAGRFGFPVIVVFDADGNLIHTQATEYLEEGQGYNQKRVLNFFNQWTPKAVEGK